MRNKPVLLALTAGVIGLAGAGATAWAATTDNTNKYPVIVDKLAEKFNLNRDEVKKVFDEQKKLKHEQRQQKIENYLGKKVKDGTITQGQKDKILAKLKELRQQLKENKHERRANHQKIHDELKQWAANNGINLNLLLPRLH
jgi:polyhydroxyalkanoate synthesis regulator phasin